MQYCFEIMNKRVADYYEISKKTKIELNVMKTVAKVLDYNGGLRHEALKTIEKSTK